MRNRQLPKIMITTMSMIIITSMIIIMIMTSIMAIDTVESQHMINNLKITTLDGWTKLVRVRKCERQPNRHVVFLICCDNS